MSESAKHLRTLRRRRDHLRDKYTEQLREELEGGRHVNAYLQAELLALDWAIPQLELATTIETELREELRRVGA